MPWVKVSDDLYSHPKIVAAPPLARSLFIAGLCHCAAGLTDGAIATGALPLLLAQTGAKAGHAKDLVSVGLWSSTATGWEVNDYLDYNPSREKVQAERDAARLRKERQRSRGRDAVDQDGASGRFVSRRDDQRDGRRESRRESRGVSPATRPVPSPNPSPSPPPGHPIETPPGVAGAGAPTEDDRTTTTVEAALDHMARCDLERAKAEGQPIRQPAAWTRAARATRAEAHRHDLARLAAGQHGVDPVDLAEQVDPACGPLDGGAARSERAWQREQAEGAEADRHAAEAKARRRRADQAIAALDPDQHADLTARAEAQVPADVTAGRKTLVRNAMRSIILTQEATAP